MVMSNITTIVGYFSTQIKYKISGQNIFTTITHDIVFKFLVTHSSIKKKGLTKMNLYA